MAKHQMTTNPEWGSKGRKAEDALRGLNAKDRRAAIAEQLDNSRPLCEHDEDAYDCDRCKNANRRKWWGLTGGMASR